MTTLEKPHSLADKIRGCDHQLHQIATHLKLDVEDYVTEVIAHEAISRAIKAIDDASADLQLAADLTPHEGRL